MVDESLLYGILGILGVYLLVRWLVARRFARTAVRPVQTEIAEILNNDEYKVKGKYE